MLEKLALWFPVNEENSELEDADGVHGDVASNLNTPLHILEKLADSRSEYVREQVARNPNSSIKIFKKLSVDRYSLVLIAVVNNPNAPSTIVIPLLEYLAGDNNNKIRQTVLLHPNVTDTAIKIINFVEHKSLVTPDLLKKLATDKRHHIRYLVATNSLASSEILDDLSNDEDTKIRYEIIKNQNTSSQTLEQLSLWLVKDLKKWCCKPYNYYKNHVINFIYLINNPNVTSQILKNIIGIQDFLVQNSILKSPMASTEVLELFTDLIVKEETEIRLFRSSFFTHPNLSTKSLEKIFMYCESKSSRFLRSLGIDSHFVFLSHPNFPTKLLEKFANHESASCRKAVARNPKVPVHILEMLANDEHVFVKKAVVNNKNTPIEIFDKLSAYF